MVDETLVPATFGNILLGGGIGIIVDSVSGAAQQYPDQILIWMDPEKFNTDLERDAWNQEKEKFNLTQNKTKESASSGSNDGPAGNL